LLRTLDHFFDRQNKSSIHREGDLLPILITTSCLYLATAVYIGTVFKPHANKGHGGSAIWIELSSGTSSSSQAKVNTDKQEVPIPSTEKPVTVSSSGKANQLHKAEKILAVAVPKPALAARRSSPAQKPSQASAQRSAEAGQKAATEAGSDTTDKSRIAAPAMSNTTAPVAVPQVNAGPGATPEPRPQPLAVPTPEAKPPAIAMGNIAPYRRDVLTRIAHNFHPKALHGAVVLVVTIDRDGNLVDSEIFTSSGNTRDDAEALEAARKTKFEHLPDWFKGAQLKFKIQLVSVEETG
jgi:TonB family protein